MASAKPVHTLVLDTGAIIKNEPSVSSLIAKAESLVTVPAIISEIRDAVTRQRVETMLTPFLTIRQPTPASLKFVTEFARRTGDLAALSKPDLTIIALTYELECERNGGDWRLRRAPGQKGVNGPIPAKQGNDVAHATAATPSESVEAAPESPNTSHYSGADARTGAEPREIALPPAEGESATSLIPGEPTDGGDGEQAARSQVQNTSDQAPVSSENAQSVPEQSIGKDVNCLPQDTLDAGLSKTLAQSSLEDKLDTTAPSTILATEPAPQAPVDLAQNSHEDESGSDSEGWITPANLKKKQAEDTGASVSEGNEPKGMQVGVLTTDFAMQNVILQINLNLLSTSLQRIRHIRSVALRCHACFLVTKQMDKQFCPRCGQPTMTKVSCSTTANGEFKVHLKKNYQYNSRGDRYSVPKPVHGSANGRIKGGGKGGWGHDLILAEDQKEYERASKTEKRAKEKNLMDEDYLPGILTGDRGRAGGRTRVGAGRNVNARKR